MASYDPADLKAKGDAAAQQVIASRLADLAPRDRVLSEEAPDDAARVAAERVWIIDPLDGTREYAERDGAGRWRDDWAVHVALWTRDAGLAAGAVALPARNRVYVTGGPVPPREEPAPALRIAVSRSHPSDLVQQVITVLGATSVPMGSAGVKVMSVIDGRTDAYVHAGGQFQWDSAAPVAVARHAGLTTARVDGSDLIYNEADPWLPDLVVCHPNAAPRIWAAIAAARTSKGIRQ